MTGAHRKGNLRGRQAGQKAAHEQDNAAFQLWRSCAFWYWRSTGETEISELDQSPTNPVARDLLKLSQFWCHPESQKELSSASGGIMHTPLEVALHVCATAGGLKGVTRSPLCSINLNKPSLSLAILKYSLLSLPASTAGGPNYVAHDSSVPPSCHIILSFSYCCEGKVISQRKNLQLRFYYTVLFSVLEMVSWLHKTYSFKTLDFNDMKKHWASCHHITNVTLRAKPMRVWIHQD